MKRFLLLAACLAAVAATTLHGAEPARLLVGVGKAEIVPPANMPLAGYGARGNAPITGIHDQIYARALIFEAGGRRVALVNSDTLQVLRELRAELMDRVKDLKLDDLELSATHSHGSMGGYLDDPMVEIAVLGRYHPKAHQALVDALAAAVRRAAGSMQPAKLGAAAGPCPPVGQNRRHQGGPIDPTIRVLGVWGDDGKLLAAVMNHAIHPTTLGEDNTKITGDNAGRAEWALEQKHPGAVALFLNSGLGDQGAGMDEIAADWDRVAAIGDAMAGAAEALLATIVPTDQVELAIYRRPFAMPPVQLRVAYECFWGLSPIMEKVGKNLIRAEGETAAVRLNNALFLFSSGEISLGVQQAIEKVAPAGTIPFVVSHANDWYGYILLPEDYDTGGYESCMNLYGRDFGAQYPAEFQRMMEAGPVK